MANGRKSQKPKKKKIKPADFIPTKLSAATTSSIRADLEGEVFENATPQENTPKSHSPVVSLQESSSGKVAESASSTETTPIKTDAVPTNANAVNILPDQEPMEYENEILSIYENTAGTQSLDSIETMAERDLTKAEFEEIVIPDSGAIELIEYPTTAVDDIQKSKIVYHPQFCTLTSDPTTSFPTAEVKLAGHTKTEHAFLQKLMNEVYELVQRSGKTNVHLDFKFVRETNGYPRLKIEMIRRSDSTPANLSTLNSFKVEKFLLESELEKEKHLVEERKRERDQGSASRMKTSFNRFIEMFRGYF